MKNLIAFRNGFVTFTTHEGTYIPEAMSMAAELMQFGYILSPEAIDALQHASLAEITRFYEEVIPFLQEQTGR